MADEATGFGQDELRPRPPATGETTRFPESDPTLLPGAAASAEDGQSEGGKTQWDSASDRTAEQLPEDATQWSVSDRTVAGRADAATQWDSAAPLSGPPDLGASKPIPGRTFGPFRIEEELGEGGMGRVFLAREEASGRQVALKVIHHELVTEKMRARFEREGRLAASLRHPGIVTLHSAGEVAGTPYLAYALVPGASTLDLAWSGLGPRERVEMLLAVAEAIGHAHERQVVHRDLKPGNILVDSEGRVRVADFGLATGAAEPRLTRTGASLGTPSYMAPEQVRGKRAEQGPATDVWALGVLLYQALTDERPFRGAGGTVLDAICKQEPVPPRELAASRPDAEWVSPALEAVCLAAIRKDPGDRYADAGVFAAELSRAASPQLPSAISGARGWVLLFSIAAAAALGLAAWGVARTRMLTAPAVEERPALILYGVPASGRVAAEGSIFHLVGTVRGQGPCQVWAADGALVPVLPGRRFSLPLGLQGKTTVFRIRVLSASGLEGEAAELTVLWTSLPRWFEALGPRRRPPLPLPEGLSIDPEQEQVYRWDPDGSQLVWIPSGRFQQGSLAPNVLATKLASATLGPPTRRWVTMSRGVFMGRHEVTQAQFARFCEATGRTPPSRSFHLKVTSSELVGNDFERTSEVLHVAGDDEPVSKISWEAAAAYCAWAGLRLPSEAEWEFAAVGTDGHMFPWGAEAPSPELLNAHGVADGYEHTAPVGSFPDGASPFGCLDMAGNVREWVADWAGPYGSEDATDPTGPEEGKLKVLRGGSWAFPWADGFRASARTAKDPDHADERTGFRVAFSPRRLGP